MNSEFERGYVSGLIDAEASFSVSVKVQHDLRCKVRVDPVFSITQRSKEVLKIVRKPGQRHLWILLVDGLDELSQKLIPALDRLKLVEKKDVYALFRKIVLKLAEKKYSLNCDDIRELVKMAYKLSELNKKSARKRSLKEVLSSIPL